MKSGLQTPPTVEVEKMKDSTFITRVILKNYKSIAACDVQLQSLTFLVGRNGAGKSNFLDALRFVADALNPSLDHAVRARGGINDVCCRSHGHPKYFSIRLEFALSEGFIGHYAFQIRKPPPGGYEVQTEECRIQNELCLTSEAYFRVENRCESLSRTADCCATTYSPSPE